MQINTCKRFSGCKSNVVHFFGQYFSIIFSKITKIELAKRVKREE
jgi:hypothetical protein